MNAIREILEKDYTALEKGLAISCVLMLGIYWDLCFRQLKGRMLGSKNGCNNHYNSGGNHAALKKIRNNAKNKKAIGNL